MTEGGAAPRSGWAASLVAVGRVVLFAFLWMVASAVALQGLGMAAPDAARSEGAQYGAMLLGAVLATVLMARAADPRPWSTLGLDGGAARPRRLSTAALVGALPIASVTLLLAAVGLLRFVRAPDGSWWAAAGSALLFLAGPALTEELVFRGYPFAVLRERWGPVVAILVTSVAFGLVHAQNEGATPIALAFVVLAGIFLAGVLLVWRSLWAAWAAHLAWNWAMAALLHVSVSGLPFATPDYRLVDAGPDWLTGGSWGPEGGAGAGLGMLGGIGYLYLKARRARREEIPGS